MSMPTCQNPLRMGRFKLRTRGFSLVEILVVLAIVCILLFMALPNLSTVRGGAELTAAKNKARELNVAKSSYLTQAGAAGEASWAALATSDTTQIARYTLIKPFIGFAPADLASFMPEGYTVDLTNSLYKQVVLYEAGTAAAY